MRGDQSPGGAFAFRTPPPNSRLFEAARDLGDSQSQTLGLLPYAAWEEYASEQRILCVIDGPAESDSAERLLAYAAFRLPRNDIALTHLAVQPHLRNRGVARQLVNELRTRFPDRRGISARCRRDYPANNAWPRLGFVARGDRAGRSAAGHLLTDWWYDFGHPDLWTWEGGTQTTTPVVIDANVFLAIHVDGGDGRVAQVLRAVEDRVQILVTPELSNELNRNPVADERKRLLQIAQSYPTLSVDPAAVHAIESRMLNGLSRRPVSVRDRSDLRHVAYAAAAGIDIVVTEDQGATSRLQAIAREQENVFITNPAELVVRVDEREDEPSYAPHALKETGYKLQEAEADSGDVGMFLNNPEGERRQTFRAICNRLAAARPLSHRLVLREPSSSPVGLIGTSPPDDVLTVKLLRTLPCALRTSVAAQLVGQLRVLAAAASASIIVVEDEYLDTTVYDALLEDGYHPFEGGMVAVTVRAAVTAEKLKELLGQIWMRLTLQQRAALDKIKIAANQQFSPSTTYQLEHQLRPVRIVDAELSTWLIPIKPYNAMELFGYPPSMFERKSELGIQREHVYFRGAKSGESAPGRILWYASHPQYEVFAVSSLVEVLDLPPKTAYKKFHRFGIYELQQLETTASSRGTVRSLRVTDTALLDTPVPLSRLRQIEKSTGRTLQLVSASKLDTEWFTVLMEEAFSVG
jgi:GNAT superfamily N-acetyltransferase/predicted nucleic acid-binding protein